MSPIRAGIFLLAFGHIRLRLASSPAVPRPEFLVYACSYQRRSRAECDSPHKLAGFGMWQKLKLFWGNQNLLNFCDDILSKPF
jgi:hypothetical protein